MLLSLSFKRVKEKGITPSSKRVPEANQLVTIEQTTRCAQSLSGRSSFGLYFIFTSNLISTGAFTNSVQRTPVYLQKKYNSTGTLALA
jgi:hypothetical protein